MPSVLPKANASRNASDVSCAPDASIGTTSIKLAAPVRPCTTPTRKAFLPALPATRPPAAPAETVLAASACDRAW